jgi:integral membrane protein
MNNANFLRVFRIVAFVEGISLLVLFFVAMPMKYWLGMPQLISPVGMAHGLLFVAYVVLALLAKSVLRWSVKDLAIVLIASLIPWGTFYIEKKYLQD